jgi:hypothetical protein
MTQTISLSVSPLVAALNDRSRARIADPVRGTNHISIAADTAREAAQLATQLDQLDITYQANFQRDKHRRPIRALLTIYGVDDQRRLLESVGDELRETRRSGLEKLVVARGLLPTAIVKRIENSRRIGKSYAYIAARLNELNIAEGRGGGPWTARKVRRKLAEAQATAEDSSMQEPRAA